MTASALTARTGTVVGDRFELTKFIAAGGMGEIWAARDLRLGRRVAVKLLPGEFADTKEFRDRFRAEARAIASINHPNVVSVFDFGEGQGPDGVWTAYLVMELVAGPPLSTLIGNRGPLPAGQVASIIEQAAAGLAAAHARGLVHRDVKPGNLLVAADGTVKVTDFGIAAAADPAAAATGTVVGTAQYLSPEQAAGQPAGPRSDLYSLGVVAFTALTGGPPFDRPTEMATALAHLRDETPPLPAGTPPLLAELVRGLLAKDPADRPATAAEVARLAAAAMPTSPPRVPQQVPPPVAPAAGVIAATRSGGDHRRAVITKAGALRVGAVALMTSCALVGLAASAGGAPTQVDVPRLTGEQLTQAQAALARAGLAATVRTVDVAEVPAGVVVGERPGSGWRVSRGSSVQLTVASGRVRVDATDYVGQPYGDAVSRLSAAGLLPVEQFVTSAEPSGTVLSVSPAGEISVGSEVTIAVALPAPVALAPPSPPASPRHDGRPTRHGNDH